MQLQVQKNRKTFSVRKSTKEAEDIWRRHQKWSDFKCQMSSVTQSCIYCGCFFNGHTCFSEAKLWVLIIIVMSGVFLCLIKHLIKCESNKTNIWKVICCVGYSWLFFVSLLIFGCISAFQQCFLIFFFQEHLRYNGAKPLGILNAINKYNYLNKMYQSFVEDSKL